MLKRITLIFDDKTVVFMSGDADHISDMIKGEKFRGFVLHEGKHRTGISKEELDELYQQEYADGGWDIEALRKLKHQHDWLIVKDNVRFREEDGTEFIIDFYRCECGAGGRVKTPKAEYDKGNKVLGIEEVDDDTTQNS